MTLVSAFCENPTCNSVFFSNSMFNIGPNGTVELIDCKIGPCPKCGSFGNVPNGTYTAFEQKLHNPYQVAIIQKALRIISQNTIFKNTPQNLRSELVQEVPELSKWLPKNFTELSQFISALVLVLQLLYNVYCDQTKETEAPKIKEQPPIQVTVDVSQAISALLNAQQNTQLNNHQQPQLQQQPEETNKSQAQNKASKKTSNKPINRTENASAQIGKKPK